MGLLDEDLWPLRDFGFRSGCGHMLPGAEWHPALLLRREVRGQLHQYSLLTSLLDPWRTASLLCTLAIRATRLKELCVSQVSFTEREIDDQSRASQTSSMVCSFCLSSVAVTLSRVGPGLS